MKDFKLYLAEFIGTFYLCFAGISTILATAGESIDPNARLLAIALGQGLTISVIVCIFGGISGAHINPAVTIGMLVTGRIRPPLAGGYIVAQLLGATVAAGLCKTIFADAVVQADNLGITLPAPGVGIGTLLLVEFVLTFLLVTAIFGTAIDERGKSLNIGAFGIGLAVTVNILAGGPVTGASMNPARSFGPVFIQGHFGLHWCYWIAPIAGSIAAALLYHHVILKEER